MISHGRNLKRLTSIAYVLAKHDALFVLEDLGIAPLIRGGVKVATLGKKVEGRSGERLARAFEELGPCFIKLGQALSCRADLIGEQLAEDLSSLRDRVPPFSGETAKAIIEKELEAPVNKLFKELNTTPIAAASIAQVHRATTNDGRKVAVKVLRPGIEQAFTRDIDLLYWAADLAERAAKERVKRMKLHEVIDTLEESIRVEMDLRFEAAAASELKENFSDTDIFYVPEIDWRRTSQRVLTTEWIDGINIAKKPLLEAKGVDRNQVLQHAADVFFLQVFRDGFFHADMHPGNVFIGENGQIQAVDFGIMGRLDQQSRLFIAEILLGFLKRDYERVAQVHFDAGYVPKHQNKALFAQACRSVGEPIFGLPINEISVARLLGQMFKIAEDFEMEAQPQLLMLQKTMMMAEGLGRMLNPNVNMWQLSEPLIEQWAREHLGPEAQVKAKLAEAGEMLSRLNRTIRNAEHLSHAVTKQGIRLHPDTVALLQKRKRRWWPYVLTSLATVGIVFLLALALD